MYQPFYIPTWFQGWDILFDGIGLIIALLIAGYSWRVYRISSENKYAYFSLAFVLVGMGFVFKMLTQGLVYYSTLRSSAQVILAPVVGMAQTGINYSDLFFRGGFLLYMVTMLGAWLLIFFISQKKEGRLKKYYELSQIGLFVYLVILISVVSNFKYFVFYLTSMVILGVVVLNYYKNYLNANRSNNSSLVLISFLLILISYFFFVFVFLWNQLYVLGEIFMLGGFLMLLYTYRKITKITY
tara:strand:+ start:105 stop:827 length:723 start_codon:yes stop_codon:yes gene_type:complete